MSIINNIDQNEEDFNPSFNGGKKNPFSPGPDYFSSFSDKISARIQDLDEIAADAPLLTEIPRYNLFDVPGGYFDELPTLIQQKCNDKKDKTSFLDWLLLLIRPNFAIPVACVIALAVSGIYFLNRSEGEKMVIVQELTVEEQLQQIDESTMIDALASVSTEESDPENEMIKEYLIENDIDEQNIDNEL
jgi:hypothetical protein